ncbi:N-6 DNA methylase [Luteolibacter algae]|uniref:site-specific DNA-methyltransferase (adenine-specific) n=1 Tax=Luteolibacter algae TaxID=454151 RepID=A0ABW5DF27_9BACT
MHWTEPATADDSHAALEKKLWDAANMLWAGADLKPSEYSPTVLGLIFLRYADVRFADVEKELGRDGSPSRPSSRRKISATDYHAAGVIYLPENARFADLLSLPEGANTGQAINDAMRAIEKENPDLADVLPKTYHILDSLTLAELLKVMASVPMDKGGDTFGLIYEYFLGKFAMTEGQKGGEFYTPTSIVKLIVEILEPYHGRILDPACGSGGMFIQSARFVEAHRANRTLTPGPSPRDRGEKYTGDPTTEISVHGQDQWAWGAHLRRAQRARRVRQRRKLPNQRVTDTSRLARLNLAVHGLNGDIKQGNTYYEDLQDSVGRFDFVMANPPFNVSKIDKERLSGDPRYPFGIPRTDNGNYLWIQHFHSALNRTGRAGFVMANSAADARASEQEIREKIIRAGDVDVMVAIGPNFFFTVTLPCTLWFFDKGKAALPPSPPAPLPGGEGSKKKSKSFSPSERGGGEGLAEYDYKNHVGARYRDTVLFIDARHIYRQLDRAHRDFTPAQLEFLANLVRYYRGEDLEFAHGSGEKWEEVFGDAAGYTDVPGLCKAATLAEIEAQGWSLNPGRYVGVAKGGDLSDEDFKEQLEALNEELEVLNAEARELEERIAENVMEILEA